MIYTAPNVKPSLGTPLNRSHPLAPDLGAFVFNERSGKTSYNSSQLNHGTHIENITWGGEGVRATPGARITLVRDPSLGLSVFSIVMFARWLNSGSSQGLGGAHTNNSNTTVRLGLSATGTPFFSVNGSLINGSLISNNINTWFAGVYDDRPGYAVNRIYQNGLLTNEAASTGAIGVGSPPSFDFLQNSGSSSSSFQGTVYLAYLYSRALTVGELTQLMVAPYEMFWTPRRRWFHFWVEHPARIIFKKA